MTSSHDSTSIPAVPIVPVVVPTGSHVAAGSSDANPGNDQEKTSPRPIADGEHSELSKSAKQQPVMADVEPLDRAIVWDVPFDRVTMRQAVDQIERLIQRGAPAQVITANLNYVMLHHQDERLRRVTESADLVLADGQPIVWRSRWGADPLPERVAGSEMIHHLAARAGERGWGIYFLGGEPAIAKACADKLAAANPGMRIAGIESPPFRTLTDQERQEQAERIRSSGADLMLVAFGQPKGEYWIHENREQLGVPVCIQVGASFDFVAGTAKRAPRIWQRLGAEWAYRMLHDPRRLIPRYAANAGFLAKAIIRRM